MFKYYRWCVVFPFLLTLLLLVTFMLSAWVLGRDWLQYRETTGAAVLLIFMFSIMMAGLFFLPVFLNNYAAVRDNQVLRFLSWWGLPLAWIAYISFNGSMKKEMPFFDGTMVFFLLLNMILHAIGGVIGWLTFNRDRRAFQREYGRHDG
ncbi:hypothetical protein [Chitinophaga sp. Cy-1792]|uniref:hypothetical protein n=1 Tax=Chitinophaga sp. Cy-1792 TaxID=2608339 RepID=UPI001421EB15|nr:hypothetical protein [Chitinophaga sp. Cy-1792]NIG54840.1 hypothetical protein [Chitinophaga sp. Cy-1792]